MLSQQTPYSGPDLARMRRMEGISARELAARMGVTKQRISAIEALARVPDAAAARYQAALAELSAES